MSNIKKRKKSIVVTLVLLILIVVTSISIFILVSNNKISNEKMQQEINNAWVEASNYEINSFMQKFDEKSSFEVIDINEKEENCYVVNCEIASPDILNSLITYQNSLTSVPTEKEMNIEIEKIISESSIKKTQQTVTVYKTEEGYSIEFTKEFINAMYGYSYDYCKSQVDELINNLTK